MIREARRNPITGTVDTKNLPASIKSEAMAMDGFGGKLNFVIDKKSGHLTSMIGEFERSTPELEKKSKAAAEKPLVSPSFK